MSRSLSRQVARLAKTVPVTTNRAVSTPFPFRFAAKTEKKARIRTLAEELDSHRKRVQARQGLTLTGLYNVLEKVRAHEPLTDKEKIIHERGLVSVLKQL